MEDLMEKAAVNRVTGATDANAQSSRSHCIFTLYLTGVHEDGACVTGILNLCDLAGEWGSGCGDGWRWVGFRWVDSVGVVWVCSWVCCMQEMRRRAIDERTF
jgi:hypothetical protein